MNEQKLYPIGTVVKLKNSPSTVMIIGYYPIVNGTEHQYLAVNYPFGLGFCNDLLLTDKASVETVLFEREADKPTEAFLTILQDSRAHKENGDITE